MKNFLSVIVFMLAFSIGLSAQSLSPRFGITKNDDNTGRVLTYKFINTADKSGVDTISLTPSAYTTLIIPSNSIKDTLTYSLKSTVSSFAGDIMEFSFTNTTGSNHKIFFIGSSFQFSSSGGTITLTTAKRAAITFRFDGVAWVETSRVVQ